MKMIMNRTRLLLPFFLLLIVPTLNAQSVPENLELRDIFMEPVIPGIRPSFDFFSADQTEFYFSWNDSSHYDTGTYVMPISGGVPVEAEDEVIRPLHSPDGRRIAYFKEGAIYVSNSDGSAETELFRSTEREYGLNWSPDGSRIAFIRSGDVWVAETGTQGVRQVTGRENGQPGYSIASWAGNSSIIVNQFDHSASRTIYFPEYADEFVVPGQTRRGLSEMTTLAVQIDSMKTDTLTTGPQRSTVRGADNGQYVAIDFADHALKVREIQIHDLYDNSMNIVFEDSTEGWLHGRYLEFSPDSELLFFLSEQDGWNHIYTVKPDGTDFTQVTTGEWEVSWARWLDANTILYAANDTDHGVRHIYKLDIRNNSVDRLTSGETYRYQFQLSPDKNTLIYAKTYFNEPYDLYRLDLEEPGREIRLTDTVPERFNEFNWQKEQYVHITGRDGETILPMSVLYPSNFDNSNQYPIVVFVHGAGSLQNVYKGWSNNYWREYMFNQFLNKNGYIVIEVDYRHSTGYGRKFREDVTNWLGRYETQDIVDGLDWLQKETRGALDLGRVGIYGGSYGGFMALYALTAEPDRFHAGAALRKVSNWRNYYYANPGYTLPRLGDPEEVPEHYDRSSPLTYAAELTHPVILLHGLIDDNVGSQDAFQYAEELIQNGNEDFEMMIYPTERHGFTSPSSWYDEYRRIFEFFERTLK